MFLQDALANPDLTRKWGETGEIDYGQDEEQIHFDKAVHEENFQKVERCLNDRAELARNELSSWAEGVLMMPAKGRNRPLLEWLMRFGAQVRRSRSGGSSTTSSMTPSRRFSWTAA